MTEALRACSSRVHPIAFPCPPGIHESVAFLRSVVPSPEPLVQRQGAIGIVHLEVFVVEVVREGVGIHRGFVADRDPIEADMTHDSAGTRDMKVIKRGEWVRRHDQVNQPNLKNTEDARPGASTGSTRGSDSPNCGARNGSVVEQRLIEILGYPGNSLAGSGVG